MLKRTSWSSHKKSQRDKGQTAGIAAALYGLVTSYFIAVGRQSALSTDKPPTSFGTQLNQLQVIPRSQKALSSQTLCHIHWGGQPFISVRLANAHPTLAKRRCEQCKARTLFNADALKRLEGRHQTDK